MNTCKIIVISMASMVLLAGCRSSRHAARTTNTDAYTGASQQVADNTQKDTQTTQSNQTTQTTPKTTQTPKSKSKEQRNSVEAISAKMNLTLRAGSKKVKLNGTYRLKRNEVVQLNLTYMALFVPINVGILELTPDYILLVDRIHKRYCRASYTEIPQLAQVGVDFDYLQHVFWGEAEKSPVSSLDWSYSDWQPLGDGEFPGGIDFLMKPTSTTYRAEFSLSNITANSSWTTRTEVSSDYSPMSLDSALAAIMAVAK